MSPTADPPPAGPEAPQRASVRAGPLWLAVILAPVLVGVLAYQVHARAELLSDLRNLPALLGGDLLLLAALFWGLATVRVEVDLVRRVVRVERSRWPLPSRRAEHSLAGITGAMVLGDSDVDAPSYYVYLVRASGETVCLEETQVPQAKRAAVLAEAVRAGLAELARGGTAPPDSRGRGRSRW